MINPEARGTNASVLPLRFREVKGRVGVMATGLAAYWPQFPGIRETLIQHHDRLLQQFSSDADLVKAGMVDGLDQARRAGELFTANDVDLVICQITTYSTSETLLPAIRDLNVPILLVNVQAIPALNFSQVTTIGDWLGMGITCAALPEMTAGLRRLGKRFDLLTGHLDDDRVKHQLNGWYEAATVARRLRKQSLGLLGRPYPGMLDLYVDETNIFKVFGTYIVHLNWDDIQNELASVSAGEQREYASTVSTAFEMPCEIRAEDLDHIAQVLGALVHLVHRHDLIGLANHFEGQPQGQQTALLAASNPALSMLMQAGVACPVEGDIKCAIAMIILKRLAGSATLAELYSMDFNADVCLIGHSGAGDPNISERKPTLAVTKVFHGKSGQGYTTQFYPQLGPVTLLAIAQTDQGGYQMIVAQGECVEGPLLDLGDTNCRVRFDCGLTTFVNQWSAHGPTHHAVLGQGHHLAALRRVALLLNISLEVVG